LKDNQEEPCSHVEMGSKKDILKLAPADNRFIRINIREVKQIFVVVVDETLLKVSRR
jgi:hypothetical protein